MVPHYAWHSHYSHHRACRHRRRRWWCGRWHGRKAHQPERCLPQSLELQLFKYTGIRGGRCWAADPDPVQLDTNARHWCFQYRLCLDAFAVGAGAEAAKCAALMERVQREVSIYAAHLLVCSCLIWIFHSRSLALRHSSGFDSYEEGESARAYPTTKHRTRHLQYTGRDKN